MKKITITEEEYKALKETNPIYKEDSKPYNRVMGHIWSIVTKYEGADKIED